MIASVAFQKFKALRNTSLRLVPFNLVIGPNGSGKTSLIQAILRLRTLSKLPPADPAVPHPTRQDGPGIEFTFMPPHAGVKVSMLCVSDVQCDTLLVEPANTPDWPPLKAEIGRIRSWSWSMVVQTGHLSRFNRLPSMISIPSSRSSHRASSSLNRTTGEARGMEMPS